MGHLEGNVRRSYSHYRQNAYLLRRVDANVVLLYRDTQLLQRLFALFLHFLRPRHLILPCLVQALHQFLTGLHLLLQFGFGDGLDLAVFRLVGDPLFLGGYSGIEGVLRARASRTR